MFTTKDEVDPLVQVLGDVLALERGAIFMHKVKGVGGPGR